ncbi:unnamed protein product [Candidula unifasciata]|uniref:Uncharacterized protein n=1 Tax=Candidula unifasciata TaxID=100452 RepID=A0A8S3ZV06_9EUPU|nr:unnamed protein product [Candidula unifasciata]
MSSSFYFLVVLHGILIVVLGNNLCIFKECDCEGTIILCSELGLTKIPERVATNYTDFQLLDLEINMITSIPSGSLPANIQELTLMENPIATIDDSAFDDCANTLQTLTFSAARFTRIPDAFLRLKQLKSFSIYGTTIWDWNPMAMNSLGQTLQTLDLVICNITIWPQWVKNFTGLTELNLSGNFISSIPDDALDLLSNILTSLSLANNSLTSVPKTFSKLNALTMLNLQQNRISDVSWLPPNCKLTSLSLNFNKISDAVQLSNALLPFATSLNHLDVDNNILTAIPDLGFLKFIPSLDFSSNKMSDSLSGSAPPNTNSLDFESNAFRFIPKILWSVKEVTYMILSSNRITDLGEMSFPPWIVGAELGYNLLVELKDLSFPENSTMQFLNLNNNPICRISDNAFKNLPQLYFLNLQYTELTRLPLGLASAKGLSDLDLSGSVYLVCTCAEINLRQWILSRSDRGVNGDCGSTSIWTFYRDLSPFCPEPITLNYQTVTYLR